MPGEVERSWFVPGTGIDRHVITTDIQRYLGNDATARPGTGTGAYLGVPGYWIKAYRNLTTAMIADLKADSARWVQEQTSTRQPGANYSGSRAQEVSLGRDHRAGVRSSPDHYPVSSGRMSSDRMPVGRAVDRMPVDRMPVDRMPVHSRSDRMDVDSMDIDPPRARENYGGDRGGFGQDTRRFPVDNRSYQQSDSRPAYASADTSNFGRAAAPSGGYGAQDSNYGRGNVSQPANDGAPPGYVRQGDFYVPITSVNQQASSARTDAATYGGSNTFGAATLSRNGPDPRDRDMHDLRDPRSARDTRGSGRNERYEQDSYGTSDRYAYPSPAMTVTSTTRDGQQSPYGASGQSGAAYDSYGGNGGTGRPVMSGKADPRFVSARTQSSTGPAGFGSAGDRDARRRRVQ